MRQIQRNAAQWCTRKDAWSITGRSLGTIDRLRKAGVIRQWWHPARGLLLYVPDLGAPPVLAAAPTPRRDRN